MLPLCLLARRAMRPCMSLENDLIIKSILVNHEPHSTLAQNRSQPDHHEVPNELYALLDSVLRIDELPITICLRHI